MFTGKIRRTLIILLSLVTVSTLVTTAACTPAETEMLRGVLENVDSVNGKVTIVTKDGKTVTVKIAIETEVKADGANASLEALEPGASVDVEVKKEGRVARRIEARQAEAEGIITAIKGDEITIETERGNSVTVRVTDSTRIKLEDDLSGTLADLRVGMEVEAKFDPSTRIAFKIEVEEAEAEGIITAIKGDEITIETERGNSVTVRVTDSTRIKFEDDLPATLADLRVGMEVEAKFDPSTHLALKIKVEEEETEPSALLPAMEGWGIIEIRVTDPPPADVKSAVVYLRNIEVHKVSDNASDNASGWIPIIGAPPSFDLMDVIGVTEILGSANVTAGRFTQIRMDVDRVEVVTVSGDNFTAEVPGEKLKIVRPFNVGAGGKIILTLDFDGEKSLIVTGRGKFLFKPVVKLLVAVKGEGGGKE